MFFQSLRDVQDYPDFLIHHPIESPHWLVFEWQAFLAYTGLQNLNTPHWKRDANPIGLVFSNGSGFFNRIDDAQYPTDGYCC